MEPKIERIKKKFGGKLIGNTRMQSLVCETLLLFPKNIVDFVTKNVWFVSSFDDSWGFVLDSRDLGSRHLVFLSDDLFSQRKYAQTYTIAHEIGHVILGHRNALLEPQTKEETARQEVEADKFARQHVGQP